MDLVFNKLRLGNKGPWSFSACLTTKKKDRYLSITTPDRLPPHTLVLIPSLNITWIPGVPGMKHWNISLDWLLWNIRITYSSSSWVLQPEDWKDETADPQ